MLKHDIQEPPGTGTASLPDVPYEIVDGVVREKPMSLLSQMVGARLHTHLDYHCMTHKLGWFTTETAFDFVVKKNRRCPDLAFVSYERWPRDKAFKITDGWDVVPEIAVEVLSPSNTVVELTNKTDEYFGHGVAEVWIVHPEKKRIEIRRSATDITVLTEADTLTCERFLPGFAVPLSEIFIAVEDSEIECFE